MKSEDKGQTGEQKLSFKQVVDVYWPSLAASKVLIIFGIFLTLTVAVINALEPYVYGFIVDTIIKGIGSGIAPAQGFASIQTSLWQLLAITLASMVGVGLNSYVRWSIWNRMYLYVAGSTLARVLTLDNRIFQEARGGELMQEYTKGTDAASEIVSEVMKNVFMSVALLMTMISVGLYVSPVLTGVSLITVPFIIVNALVARNRIVPKQRQVEATWNKGFGIAGDALNNINVVKGFVGEGRVEKRYIQTLKEATSAQLSVNKGWAISDAIYDSIYAVSRLLILGFGASMALAGKVSPGDLVMFLSIESKLNGSIIGLTFALPNITRMYERARILAKRWYQIPDVKNAPDATKLKSAEGDIEFRAVTVTYPNGRVALNKASFIIPAGKTVALIGESGAGKSTLAQLLPRFHDPSSGQVLIGGQDIRTATLQSLRTSVGVVMQENLLFHDSILANIQFAKPGATKEEVIKAAKRAQAHQFISKLPEGYDSVVGERGVKLSGGERQRIALARVFLADPKILVLDEATSALDSKTEHDLQLALAEVMKNRTTLVIAHRLSTVAHADNIVVMDQGKVVDQGSHADLMARDSLYRTFWQIQSGGYV